MHPVSKVIALSFLIGGIVLGATYLSKPARDGRSAVDLAVRDLHLEVDPDRRVVVDIEVANQGPGVSPSPLLFVDLVGLQHMARLAPLGPSDEMQWTWLSPPLAPGDYEVVASVQHSSGALDADESDNVTRALLHVPSPSARERTPAGRVVRVPSVIGLDRRSAQRALHQAGFAGARWYERTHGVALDRVDLQWPESGRPAPRGTKPVLVAAAGRTVPNLVGVDLDQARDRLKRSGLVPGALRIERSEHYTDRSVVAQEPGPGSRIEVASAVGLVVSDPQPLWPFVIAGLMCLIALVMSLTGRYHHAVARVARNDAWVSGPLERLSERRMIAGAIAAAAIDPATAQRVTVREPPPMLVPRPTIAASIAPYGIADLRFAHHFEAGRCEVRWQDDSPTMIALRPIPDPGGQDVKWHPFERRTP